MPPPDAPNASTHNRPRSVAGNTSDPPPSTSSTVAPVVETGVPGAVAPLAITTRLDPRDAVPDQPMGLKRIFGSLFGRGKNGSSGQSGTDGEQAVLTETEKDSVKEKGEGRKKKDSGPKKSPLETALENPDLKDLKPEHARVVAEQIAVLDNKITTPRQLFRFHTRVEVLLNCLGVCAAVAAGVAQPAMALLLGNLTSGFTDYASAAARAASDPVGGAAGLEAAKGRLLDKIDENAGYLGFVALGLFLATYISMGTFIYTGDTATRRIREKYFASVLRQNIAWQDKNGAGGITTRVETDTSLLQEGISDKVALTTTALSTFFAGFIIGLVRNWRLALVISVMVPLAAGAGALFNHLTSSTKVKQLEATAKGAEIAEESIASIRSVFAFGLQKTLVDLYDRESNSRARALGMRAGWHQAGVLCFFSFLVYGIYGLGWWYATTLILQGHGDAGEVVSVIFSVLMGAFALTQLGPQVQAVAKASAAATEIFNTIDRIPAIDSSSPAGLKLDTVIGEITFENVQFIYPSRPAVPVLHPFSAVFPPGKMTALVGGSGSGKSTCIGLIERFYSPVEGTVKLDGVDLKDLNVKWLRNQIGLVSQEPTLFATTVAGNIEHGLIGSRFEHESPEDKRKRVIDAAKLANADGFTRQLPQGYDTKIGERGMLLSGGQKQRIAIARAIVSDPKILLLDEATSALDTASERIVQAALDRASKGRTCIVVAHRLSTIKNADQIIVLTAGRILESAMTSDEGTAHDLLLLNPQGAYSTLVGAQAFREARSTIDDPKKGEEDPDELLDQDQDDEDDLQDEKKHDGELDLEQGPAEEVARKHGFFYLLKRILTINKDRRMVYLLGMAGATVVGASFPVFSLTFGGAIDAFSSLERSRLRSEGDRMALYCFIIALVNGAAAYVQVSAFLVSGEDLAAKLRLLTFRSILKQDVAFFDKEENNTGHLTSSVSSFAEKVNGLLGFAAAVIFQGLSTIVLGVVIGLAYAPRVGAVAVACLPLTLIGGFSQVYVLMIKDEYNRKNYRSSAQMASEAVSAIKTVAATTREDDVLALYSGFLDEPSRKNRFASIFSNGFYSFAQASNLGVIALLFWWGSRELVAGRVGSREFFIALTSVVLGSTQAGAIFAFAPQISSFKVAASQIITLVDSQPKLLARPPDVPLAKPKLDGHLEFKSVVFRYPTRPKVPVLQGLEIEVKPGQTVALVGASGCGKSSCLGLLERFYDPLVGKIVCDNQDIRERNLPAYRRDIALVDQQPLLQAGTIRFNVALGLAGTGVEPEDVPVEEVERACREANLMEFVEGLPDGLDTYVGGKGTQLSGGQKQRVALARALIRNPRVLLLDEATSALDSASERIVEAALEKASHGRSTVVVAHRLSTIQNADIIYVIDTGRVAEKGTHIELLAKKGMYAQLVSQQTLAPAA
ncbi:hypothetical protein JCM8547_008391 [Rhodosporidiobolus lusitaniae]